MPMQDEDMSMKDEMQMPLAVPFVRMQKWEEPMSPEQALEKGTIFHSLYMPLAGFEVKKNG